MAVIACLDNDLGGVGNADDLTLISRKPYANALLIGSPDKIRMAIATLLPRLQRPIAHCEHYIDSAIHSMRQGTLVIWDIERLDGCAQRQLLNFIERQHGGVQIIAVAENDLFDLVRRGEFLEPLYYCLNVILIRVAARPAPGPALTVRLARNGTTW